MSHSLEQREKASHRRQSRRFGPSGLTVRGTRWLGAPISPVVPNADLRGKDTVPTEVFPESSWTAAWESAVRLGDRGYAKGDFQLATWMS